MPKVSMRGGFSDRNNIKPENREIQLKEFDERTRIQLQNIISQLYDSIYNEIILYGESKQDFFQYIYGTVYSLPVNATETLYEDNVFKTINETFHQGDYDEILTLIEAVAKHWDVCLKKSASREHYDKYSKKYYKSSIFEIINLYLEREYVGYRFIDEMLVPISNDIEIESIEQAIKSPYEQVNKHLSKASKLLADRESPDFENSIKESISAIEAICKILTQAKGNDATLGKMLNHIDEKGTAIHPSLKEAFNKLYGYTSDANGVRHAGNIGGPGSTFEEARFMLVSCSAFVNYLLGVSAK